MEPGDVQKRSDDDLDELRRALWCLWASPLPFGGKWELAGNLARQAYEGGDDAALYAILESAFIEALAPWHEGQTLRQQARILDRAPVPGDMFDPAWVERAVDWAIATREDGAELDGLSRMLLAWTWHRDEIEAWERDAVTVLMGAAEAGRGPVALVIVTLINVAVPTPNGWRTVARSLDPRAGDAPALAAIRRENRSDAYVTLMSGLYDEAHANGASSLAVGRMCRWARLIVRSYSKWRCVKKTSDPRWFIH
jgi:hypothetical protein